METKGSIQQSRANASASSSPRAPSPKRRRLGLGCLGLALGIAVVYYVAQALWRTPVFENMGVAAHRGGPKYAPENTLAAFRTAISQGAEAFEFDVQMSRDGALVVIHDETVDRTTNGTGAVRDLTLAQLRSLDAGDGEIIPTFDEVLQLAKAAGLTIYPEAKSAHLYPGLEQKMVQALQTADYIDHTIVVDFEPDSLERLHALDPALRLCALYGTGAFNVDAPAGNAQFICPEAEMVLLDPAMIRRAHAEGRPVIVWFLALENPFMIRTLRFFGADGFIVNDPVSALKVLPQP